VKTVCGQEFFSGGRILRCNERDAEGRGAWLFNDRQNRPAESATGGAGGKGRAEATRVRPTRFAGSVCVGLRGRHGPASSEMSGLADLRARAWPTELAGRGAPESEHGRVKSCASFEERDLPRKSRKCSGHNNPEMTGTEGAGLTRDWSLAAAWNLGGRFAGGSGRSLKRPGAERAGSNQARRPTGGIGHPREGEGPRAGWRRLPGSCLLFALAVDFVLAARRRRPTTGGGSFAMASPVPQWSGEKGDGPGPAPAFPLEPIRARGFRGRPRAGGNPLLGADGGANLCV